MAIRKRGGSVRGFIWMLGSVALVGCASKPAPAPPPAPVVVAPPAPPPAPVPAFIATPGLDPGARLREVLTQLDDGHPDQARAEAQQLLMDEPNNALAKKLLSEISEDPKVLLGEQNFSYTIKAGETLSSLAERFLNDKFMFYALARYNSLSSPNRAEVGQTILIPGVRRPAPPAPSHRRPEAAESRAFAPPPPPRPARDPARANALRAQGLVAMNRGRIDQAVQLLTQASQADGANGAITADLARAVRIQHATRR